jgi:hypothetical protein
VNQGLERSSPGPLFMLPTGFLRVLLLGYRMEKS